MSTLKSGDKIKITKKPSGDYAWFSGYDVKVGDTFLIDGQWLRKLSGNMNATKNICCSELGKIKHFVTKLVTKKKSKSVDIADLVQADIAARKKQGIKTYGKPLRANNGRNALQDAYEEALDMACYLKQALEEQKND